MTPRGDAHCHPRRDWLLRICGSIIFFSYLAFLFREKMVFFPFVRMEFFQSIYDLMNLMVGGIILGFFSVGLLSFVPREVVISIVGRPDSKRGILRAAFAGILLDLCNHGVLMVGMKLYERGASLAQVLAFLIASPWNSLSLTFILVSLVGIPLTVSFIFFSFLIAISTGFLIRVLVLSKKLPKNPHEVEIPKDFQVSKSLSQAFRKAWRGRFFLNLLQNGYSEGRMVLRWIFFGMVLTAVIRLFVSGVHFEEYLGPTLAGMGLTLVVATVLEVCSEATAPLAADFVTRAKAPGNAFAFLMTGVSTDYTELMALKSTTRSWRVALMLPLLTVPQIILVGWMLNNF